MSIVDDNIRSISSQGEDVGRFYYEEARRLCHESRFYSKKVLESKKVWPNELNCKAKEVFSLFYKAAQLECSEAKGCLGCCYMKGIGCDANIDLAIKWLMVSNETNKLVNWARIEFENRNSWLAAKLYQAASEKMDEEALFMYGFCLEEGRGVARNKEKAEQVYNKIHDVKKLVEIGDKYFTGEDIGLTSYSKGLKWYKKAAEQGYYKAIFLEGWCYENGHGTEKNLAQSQILYSTITSAEYQYTIAKEMLSGRRDNHRCYSDFRIGKEWYEKAAIQGHTNAIYKLGLCYLNGYSSKIDIVKAESLFQRITDPNEQYKIGFNILFKNVDGMPSNTKTIGEAPIWFLRAAQQGNIKAKFLMGICWIKGINCEVNIVKANFFFDQITNSEDQFEIGEFLTDDINGLSLNMPGSFILDWYVKSAKQGHIGAQFKTAILKMGFERIDDTIEINTTEGILWMRKAAQQDYGRAQLYLGQCYAEGYGALQDKMEAIKWLEQSAKHGIVEAKKYLNKLTYS